MMIKTAPGDPRPYSLAEFEADYPDVDPRRLSVDELADYGVAFASVEQQPATDEGKVAVHAVPRQENGAWTVGWAIEDAAPAPPGTGDQVNDERERRLLAGGAFPVADIADPIPLTGRPFDQSVYLALLIRAQGYKAAGVDAPILRIRSADDVIHLLTPDQMISLISQAMTWVEAVMAASWAMKDAGEIPADFSDDSYWPS